jgi:hypothetical protein
MWRARIFGARIFTEHRRMREKLLNTEYEPNPSKRSGANEKHIHICRGADKFLAFLISCFPICNTTQKFVLDGLKKLEQRSHKCVQLRGEYVNTFFQSRSFLFPL